MKKTGITLIVLLIITSNVIADITTSRYKITESEKEFDIIYYLTPDMKQIESIDNDDVAITQSFRIRKNNLDGELRYSLFTDLGGDQETLKIQFALWVFICTNNIAGYEVSSASYSNFRDSDEKKEFNGDFGCTVFILNPKSNYSKGYRYMMVEYFQRINQGLVMRTFLFNDMRFVGLDKAGKITGGGPLFDNYHTFKFMEKDQNNNYIID